jgi:hypothetical protein
VADLTAGVGGATLTPATVHDDAAKDALSGKLGLDWFLFRAPDIQDWVGGETKTPI